MPDEWKLANIIPVHKKGKKQHVENYRPISLLSVLSKVLERFVLTKIRDHLLCLINNAQHGFIPGRSCTTQLLQVLRLIGSLLDSGKQTDAIYIDMSKAFDKVDHATLLHKLEHGFSISGPLLRWFRSYLSNRRQRVTVLGCTSPETLVTSGVPRGSILEPMLFLLHVNDLPDAVQNSKVACFADDTKIFKRIDTASDTALLQQDLGNLEHRSKSCGLGFNEDKCKCQRITRKSRPVQVSYILNESPLTVTPYEKDLGVWVASDLTWSKHITEGCAKANKLLGFLRRTTLDIGSVRTRPTLYLAVVRPALGYATQVWCPQTVKLIEKLERIERRATKYVLGLPFLCAESYKERLLSTDLLPLCYWHELLDLVFFYKATHGLVTISPESLPPRIKLVRTTRSTVNPSVMSFRPRKCRTTTFQNSFFVRASRTWNTLPEKFRLESVTLNQFKTLLLEYYERALARCYCPDDPRSFKTICRKCNTARLQDTSISCCF